MENALILSAGVIRDDATVTPSGETLEKGPATPIRHTRRNCRVDSSENEQ
jgi:hypothetical protein